MVCLNNMKLVFVSFFLLSPSTRVIGARHPKTFHNVPWDPRITEQLQFHSIHTIEVRMNEYMEIHCPQFDADEREPMTFVIYNVSKKSFDKCVLSTDSVQIFRCDSPSISKVFTTKFQLRSPNPLGFTFRPGHTYYYMSFVGDSNTKNKCDNVLRLAVKVLHKATNHHTKHVLHPTNAPTPSKSTSTSEKTTTTSTTTTTTTKIFKKPTPERTSDNGRNSQQLGGTGGTSSQAVASRMLWVVTLLALLFVGR